jgi:hypothetical protein
VRGVRVQRVAHVGTPRLALVEKDQRVLGAEARGGSGRRAVPVRTGAPTARSSSL